MIMSYKHVMKLFEDRKCKLQDLVECEELAENNKLKLQGAIDEIDFLLSALKQEMKVSENSEGIGSGNEAFFNYPGSSLKSKAAKNGSIVSPLAEQELVEEKKELVEEQQLVSQQEYVQEAMQEAEAAAKKEQSHRAKAKR
jgi:hypothetical protein